MKIRFVPVLLAGLIAGGIAVADEGKGGGEVTRDQFCAGLAELARTVMYVRQGGMSLSQTLSIAGQDDLHRSIIMAAWEEPRWHGRAAQQRAISDFRDTIHLECLRGAR